ncbi:MAG: exodeoxyribonuclease VII large subunit [Coriobacteriia bacterium]|nr:exodeoxyribonuclease VII large subunit [Coriobacteriia bacterium]MBN2841135.1 exodeoxyribonuclease VII large subunit [Coriobacteriia bacterium]
MVEREAALSVSDAMARAKGALEMVRLRVVGEVSEATIKPGYKAIYFSLKDGSSVMPCLMWRDQYDASGVRLEDGRLVEVTGNFTAYVPKGRMQFQVRSVTIAGEGMLRLEVARLARALEAEGLMAEDRKRPLPAYPVRIGVVTSPRGKAIHDVIRTLRRRYPVAEVVVAGVQVEGDGAVAEIVRGLETLAEEPGIDVIILGRGGGSYEDLMPFNAEEVARAVAASPVPVVTGIGHEPDTSIADMVADLRASTPTAAAEAVAPDAAEVSRALEAQRRRVGRALTNRVAALEHRLGLVSGRPIFGSPDALLGQRDQTLDLLATGLERAIPSMLERRADSVARSRESLRRIGPRLFEPGESALRRGSERAVAAGQGLLERTERAVAQSAARLDDLSPLAILGRGYAVCYEHDGAILRSAESVAPGARVDVRLAEGTLGCIVETVGSEK